MPMSPRLLRPIASGVHPEANAWRTAVVANGGSVSASTMKNVSKFCADIDAAGIRDKFYRLNLFCGTGLNAALVPLYRGASRTGTQYGNTTDTNNGPFVSGDYVETGSTGGLQGNGTSKYLNTGLEMNFTTPRNIHLAAYVSNWNSSNNAAMIGADTDGDGQSPRFLQGLVSFGGANRVNVFYNIGTNFIQADKTQTYDPVFMVGQATASGANLYANGTSVATGGDAGSGTNSRTYPMYVFAFNNRNNSVQYRANARIEAYSAGLALTAAQVTSYKNALSTFLTAMGRS